MIGLSQRTLPALDEASLGLRGLVILAGAPSAGKTSLALQLGTDVLRAHADAVCGVASLEMPRDDLYTRIEARLAELEWGILMRGSARPGLGEPAWGGRARAHP